MSTMIALQTSSTTCFSSIKTVDRNVVHNVCKAICASFNTACFDMTNWYLKSYRSMQCWSRTYYKWESRERTIVLNRPETGRRTTCCATNTENACGSRTDTGRNVSVNRGVCRARTRRARINAVLDQMGSWHSSAAGANSAHAPPSDRALWGKSDPLPPGSGVCTASARWPWC